ncbi:hypothetical protein FPV67DRAFT_1214771 [Lyophyllum atratum]|nr:hypothetical protein FPV67DRAFT_1214771 [Lyophyllum atratum]
MKPTVLVTGVSGFVGSHVALQLLKEGFLVRGTARSRRLESLQSTICTQHPDLTLVHLEDVATGDLRESLKGVHAIIHVATPLAGNIPPAVALASALDGTLNVLRQAVEAGVNKVVLTSSWATTLDLSLSQTYSGQTFTSSDWGHTTREEVLSGKHDALWVYLATKLLAEQAAWKFAEAHPQLDLSTINPPFIYGPLAPGFPAPTLPQLGSNRLIYSLISGKPGRRLPPQLPPLFCDVRDVARAHVSALRVSGTPPSGRVLKRYLISGGAFTWKQAVEHLAQARPELRGRLPGTERAWKLPGRISVIDAGPAREDLGMGGYIGWERCVEDTVGSLLEVEKSWGLPREVKAAL